MKIDYILLDPSKNITALVKTPVEPELRTAVAARILALEKECEQVGFLSDGNALCDVTLNMAGGEFCGNASMSAAALFYIANGKSEVSVSVSGCNEPVPVSIKAEDNCYLGTVSMPKALSISEISLLGENEALIELPGISHIVTKRPLSKAEAEKAVRECCHEIKADALGIMLLNDEETAITPLVYVPSGDTIYWEQSCASGTTAVGIYLSEKYNKPLKSSFNEPGSILTIEAAPNEHPKLSGRVEILHESVIEF